MDAVSDSPGALRGLLVDFGGVLTTDVFVAFEAFCRAESIDPQTVRDHFRSDPEARQLLFDLECGRLSVAEFDRLLGVTG